MAKAGPITYARTHRTQVIACLGYALFLAANATVVWGGVFPFLPLETQTPTMTSTFFVAQASAFAFYYFASVVRAYRRPQDARRFKVAGAAAPYLLGWACLIAIPYVDGSSTALTPCAGVLLGYGAARFFVAWQRLFAAQKPSAANMQIIAGNAVAPIIYFMLYLIPQAVTALLVALVFMPLFSLCIVLTSRAVNLDAPMFCDVPREHPQVYRLFVRDYWRSALCVGSVAFSCGVMRSLAVESPAVALVVNAASMAALLVTAVGLFALWRYRPLRLNISIFFHVLYPMVTTAFIALPVLGLLYLNAFAAALYAIYGCVVILTMIQCAQVARDRSVNPVFVYGFVAGIMYALHDVGFLFSSFVLAARPFGLDPLASAALAAVYVLGVMFFTAQGGLKAALSPNHLQAGRIELVFTNARPQRNRPVAGPDPLAAGSPGADPARAAGGGSGAAPGESFYADRISKQCALLQAHFKLTNREAQIVEAVARGNTVGAIAEQLGVSENTVRTHTKRLYTKLDIHKKQQLVELVGTFDANALNAGEGR